MQVALGVLQRDVMVVALHVRHTHTANMRLLLTAR